jgi:GMP synthase-like glutamine amidotransferase
MNECSVVGTTKRAVREGGIGCQTVLRDVDQSRLLQVAYNGSALQGSTAPVRARPL